MIFFALLIFFKFIIQGFLLLLPTGTGLPDQVAYYINLFWEPIKNLNILLPIHETLVYILPAWLALELGINIFKLANWIINKVRGAG